MKQVNQGMSMVELLAVIALITACSVFMLPTYLSEREHQEIADAVLRGQQIATSIEFARTLGLVDEFDGSLKDFIEKEDHKADVITPVLTDPVEFFGKSASEVYRVLVKKDGVRVSFGLVGEKYQQYRFPSARTTTVTNQEEQDSPVTVTWSMGASYVTGLNVVYGVNHYINVN